MKELNHNTDWWFGRKRKKKKNTFIRKKEKKIREREETQRVPERENIYELRRDAERKKEKKIMACLDVKKWRGSRVEGGRVVQLPCLEDF